MILSRASLNLNFSLQAKEILEENLVRLNEAVGILQVETDAEVKRDLERHMAELAKSLGDVAER